MQRVLLQELFNLTELFTILKLSEVMGFESYPEKNISRKNSTRNYENNNDQPSSSSYRALTGVISFSVLNVAA